MVTLSLGTKKRTFKSIKEAADFYKIDYMVFYMRLRMGLNPQTALRKPVRAYRRRQSADGHFSGQA
jgi:hypothetical protein